MEHTHIAGNAIPPRAIEVIPGHKYHCMTWWGHSRRVRSVLTGMGSSSLLNTLHRSGHGSGDDRDTGRSLGHRYLTVTLLENRNILDSRGNISV